MKLWCATYLTFTFSFNERKGVERMPRFLDLFACLWQYRKLKIQLHTINCNMKGLQISRTKQR